MRFYEKRTVEEQAQRLPEELRDEYKKSQLDRITIFDGTEEIEVTGYAEYSYLEELSYKTQPVRTNDGAINEIEQYATFLTPRLVINYNMMGIDDYRALMKMLKRRNGFIVKCYDVVEDKIVRNQMYVAPPSMPRIYQQYLVAMGVQEYAIELIGTNVPINQTEKIPFFYEGDVYYAHIGQTWREWVDTDQNPTHGSDKLFNILYNPKGDIIYSMENGGSFIEARDSIVKADDYILSEETYSAILG